MWFNMKSYEASQERETPIHTTLTYSYASEHFQDYLPGCVFQLLVSDELGMVTP